MAENVQNIRSVSQVKPISPTKLRKAVQEYQRINGEMKEAQGDLGAHVKKIEDALGVHRQAFKTGCKLEKWDTAKRQDFLRTFDAMRKTFKWDDEAQKDMIDEADTDNVVALPAAETPVDVEEGPQPPEEFGAPEEAPASDEAVPSPA